MPQTLLALAAVLMFSMFALSQHRAKADGEEFAITAEVEMAGGQLARDRLATVLSKSFDEVDIGTDRVRTDPAGLSVLRRDAGEATEADYDDVDDFAGDPARAVTSEWMGATLRFTDSVAVRYVDTETLEASAAPTLAKEVTVIVRAVPTGFVGTPPVVTTLRQIATPSSN